MQIALLPTYTATGTITPLAAPTFSAAPDAEVGDGWPNDGDDELAYVYVVSFVTPFFFAWWMC